MVQYDWKNCSAMITVDSSGDGLTELLSKTIDLERECLGHSLFSSGFYRRYRRGKNRCLRCGLKVNE